jgi:ATP-dependent RNA helicase DDX19/DBP5
MSEQRTWESLDLPGYFDLANGIAKMHWTYPLEIQAKTLPLILGQDKRNVISQAPTGKGKTGAFSIGMICSCDPNIKAPQAICIAPAREIAVQTADKTVSVLASAMNLTVFKAVKEAVARGPITDQIVVGTVGTILKLMGERKLNLEKVNILVIDEADLMVQFDMDKKKHQGGRKDKDITASTIDIKKYAFWI